ncbi:P-loop containing nucleoside triphosphate hydrolase protein [Fragilariopsis cylindrus CCMP1102]|uniref:p-loop containing nucleoside triphosphate hydrolase protein n=1 Tax=Fragilariopsis cylindrus CCMP1102 TaxID=635003 RepID=A0A1E7FMR8_9STRA|nr:P-loop containing nucleoside triphosphate hydrolase protein [Fragilariopsis cylindrus CCMP1102]|eukprot:OEU19468.1 P-loop containing nucleoside triphosphate hydrolase protein [Fragilariopsis cylindrus CCMP1102]
MPAKTAIKTEHNEGDHNNLKIDKNLNLNININIKNVLGLKCLSIVLSYLNEYDGTSFLLCQKQYWTNTILPLFRIKDNTKNNKNKKNKHRYKFVNKDTVNMIPDASTRLDRLNTRRLYIRHLRNEREKNRHNKATTTSSIGSLPITLTDTSTYHLAEKECNNNNDNPQQQLFKMGTTIIASYPRSGNTLLRSLLETITGYITSSDTRPDRTLSRALAEQPPYFVGCTTYDANRVILLVRNPFDAIDSYWNLNLTNTHTDKVIPSITEFHREFYTKFVRHEILQVWYDFIDYYWYHCRKNSIPLLIVRYEDLIINQKDELHRILQFTCNSNSNSKGQNWWKNRLEEVTRRSSLSSSYRYGYRSSSTTTTTTTTKATSAGNASSSDGSSHPSIGRSLRTGIFPSIQLLRDIHDFDDSYNNNRRHGRGDRGGDGCGWLERLGYHVYKQGFPNNLNNLPPVPILQLQMEPQEPTATKSNANGSSTCNTAVNRNQNGNIKNTLTINQQDISLELRSRDSPYGRNMRRWRRTYTDNDTKPFPTM